MARNPADHLDLECAGDPTHVCVRPLLRRAFGILWDHALLLISAHLLVFIVLITGNLVLTTLGGNMLIGPFLLGAYMISLRLVRNENTEFADLLTGFEYFLPAFLANLLIQFMGLVMIPLIIPGLLVFLTYSTTYLYILDDNVGFWDAMERSRRLVWGNFRRWLALGTSLLLINLAGFLCLVVGLLVTLPYTYVAITLMYEEEREARRRKAEAEFTPDEKPEGAVEAV